MKGVVSILQHSEFGGLQIYLGYESDRRLFVAQPVELVWQEHNENQIHEPTLHLDRFIANPLLNALAEELDKQGIKTDKDAKIEGTLEATRYHLEDMRQLVFKRKGK